MCKLFSVLTGFSFFLICSPQIFACTCLTPSLEDRIYQSPIIVLAKIKNVMAKPVVNDVELGCVTLSDLRILKGDTSSSEIFVPEFRYGDCICSIGHTGKTIKELEGTTMIVFLNEERRELDFIAHKNEKDYEDLSQRITEMVALQKQPDWKKDELIFEWYATCMTSAATWGYVYFHFLEPRGGTGTGLASVYMLKDFSRLITIEAKKRISDKLYHSSEMKCQQAYLALLAANWEDEKVLVTALSFLKRYKESKFHGCDDDHFSADITILLLPNIMRMVANKTNLHEAAKFADQLQVQDDKETVTEFLRYIETAQERPFRRKIIVVVSLIIVLAGIVFIFQRFRNKQRVGHS